jgi:beta-xylosidase
VYSGDPAEAPATSDEFSAPQLGLQWQWQANPTAGWASLTERPGNLRLHCQPEPRPANLYRAPHLLLQKFPALEFCVTTKLEFQPQAAGEQAGLLVFGYDYAWIGLRARPDGADVVQAVRVKAADDGPQDLQVLRENVTGPVWLRVTVQTGGRCVFAFSTDGEFFTDAGRDFTATCGHWVGAKVGLFASAPASARSRGQADYDWFRVTSAGL